MPTHPMPERRLLTRAEAANYCGLSKQSFSKWIREGRLPKPIFGTARWDRRSIDHALDILCDLRNAELNETDFDQWKRRKNANSIERDS